MGKIEELEARVEQLEEKLASVVGTLREQCLTTGAGVKIRELAEELGRHGYTVSYVERTDKGLRTIPKIVILTPKKVIFEVYSSTMEGLLLTFEVFVEQERAKW